MAEGSLKFVATVDNKQVLVSLEQMRGEFMRMSQSAQQSGTQLDDTFGKLKNTIAGVAGGIASVTMLKELSKQIANVRGEFQQLEVAFTAPL